jgi:DedD protein
MDEGLKKRLIGAAVLASLAVIFVPMLFEEPPSRPPPLPPLPSKPPVNDFASEMLREEVPAVTPLAPQSPPSEYRTDVSVESASAAAAVTSAPASEPRTGLTAWVVQVGSFSSQQNAAKLVAKLREAKLPTPDPEPVDLRGKRYFRVRVGPVVERSEAEGMLERVNGIAGTKARVQQYP